jgi:hypothetical protein
MHQTSEYPTTLKKKKTLIGLKAQIDPNTVVMVGRPQYHTVSNR